MRKLFIPIFLIIFILCFVDIAQSELWHNEGSSSKGYPCNTGSGTRCYVTPEYPINTNITYWGTFIKNDAPYQNCPSWVKYQFAPNLPCSNFGSCMSNYAFCSYAGVNSGMNSTTLSSAVPSQRIAELVWVTNDGSYSVEWSVYCLSSMEPIYYISGNIYCCDVELYYYNVSEWIFMDKSSSNSYSFPIMNNSFYKLIFNDGYEYEFECDGHIEYDRNICNYIYGYTCHIDWVRLYKDVAGVWEYEELAPQPSFDFDYYEFLINNGKNYKINFSDGHEYSFSCSGNDIMYDHDICVWVHPPSPYQPKEMIPWYVGFDNNIVLMKDNHGNFIENSQTAIYNKDTQSYIQKWRDTPEPYILLANNTDSNDDVIVMCKTFDGIFIRETYDPIFGNDENITWCNWTIPIMYNLNLIPLDENKYPIHDVFISMYEYTPFNPLSFHGYDNYWGHIPINNCSGFSRCDIKSEKIGYNDYVSTGLNWTSKNAMVKDYKHNINMVKTS